MNKYDKAVIEDMLKTKTGAQVSVELDIEKGFIVSATWPDLTQCKTEYSLVSLIYGRATPDRIIDDLNKMHLRTLNEILKTLKDAGKSARKRAN